MIITPGLKSGTGPWEDVSPVVRMTLIALSQQLEKSEIEAKNMKNESKGLRSELESMRSALSSSNFAIERLSSDRANLEAELRKIRRNESNLLDHAALREITVPAISKDRTDISELHRKFDRVDRNCRDHGDRLTNLENINSLRNEISTRELDKKLTCLEDKLDKFSEDLSTKAGKQSVASALHRKATREELNNEVKKIEDKLKRHYDDVEEAIAVQRDCEKVRGPRDDKQSNHPISAPHSPLVQLSSPYSPIRAKSSPSNTQHYPFSPPNSTIHHQQHQQPSSDPENHVENTTNIRNHEDDQRHARKVDNQQNQHYKASHDAFREVVIRRLDQMESSIKSMDNQVHQTYTAIDNVTARMNDQEEQSEVYLTEQSPYMFEIQVRFQELEKKVGLTDEFGDIVSTMEHRLETLVSDVREMEEKQEGKETQDIALIQDVAQLKNEVGNLQTVVTASVSQLECMVPQMDCVTELHTRMGSFAVSTAQLKESFALLSARSDAIDEIVLGPHVLGSSHQKYRHRMPSYVGNKQSSKDLAPNSSSSSGGGGGLVDMMKKYPKLMDDVSALKLDLKKVAKFAGNTEKRCQESDTTFNFLDRRIEAIGDVVSTLNKRFTAQSEESECSAREIATKMDTLTKTIFKCIEEEQRLDSSINNNKARLVSVENLIKSIIDIRAKGEGRSAANSNSRESLSTALEEEEGNINNLSDKANMFNPSSFEVNASAKYSSPNCHGDDGGGGGISSMNAGTRSPKTRLESDEEKSRRKRYELAKKVLNS